MTTESATPLRTAVERRDRAALRAAFADDAVLRSPLTNRLQFRGVEQIAVVFDVILEVIEEIEYQDEFRSGESAVLVASARIDGQAIELVDHMRFDSEGRIRELTVFFRPLPASAAAMSRIGAGVAARASLRRARVVSFVARPYVLITKLADRLGAWLVGPTLS